jgi:pimeloyl-ACP methyl ester carboxylesterase
LLNAGRDEPDPAGGALLSAARRRWRDTFSIRTTHRAGIAASGEVELFYRGFGHRGETPVLLLPFADRHDSRGWVDVASEISEDRAVVAFDARGHGKSTGSPSREPSPVSQLNDIWNLLDHLRWDTAIIVGHSSAGALALRFAAEHPQRVAGLVLVDYTPARQLGGSTRDPRDAPASVSAPLLVVRATRSAVCDDHALARVCSLAADPTVVEVDSGHDVPAEAPAELADAIRAFLPWI